MNGRKSDSVNRIRIFYAVLGSLTFCPSNLAAQANNGAGANQGADVPGLGEIIVTARRTAENLQDVPLAVSVLSAETLRNQNIAAPQDLASKMPSLTTSAATTTRDAAIYTIRGQGQSLGGSEPAVVTYFAEVPTVVTGPGLIFDLQNIQVLKGPQGTLFGRNTTGGAILLEPQRPNNVFGGYVDLTFGTYEQRRLTAAVDVPVVADKLLVRGALDMARRNGFTRDVVTGVDYDDRHYDAYRFSAIVRPFEGLESYFVVNHVESDTNGSGAVLLAVDPNSLAAQVFPNFFQLGQEQDARGPRRVIHSTPDSFDRLRSTGVTNITSLDIGDSLVLKNVFGYRRFVQRNNSDIDGSGLPIVDYLESPFNFSGIASQGSSKSYSEELRLHGSLAHSLKWVMGGYLLWSNPDSSSDKDVLIQFGGPPFILQSLKRDRSKALFAQFDYDLSRLAEGLMLTAGIRRTWDKRALRTSRYAVDPSTGCALPPTSLNCAEDDSARFNAWTWNASVQYHLNADTLLYASARKGYKSGGFNVTSLLAEDRNFGPEYVHDLELGLKSQFFVGSAKVRANAALFRGKYTDIQQNVTITNQVNGVDNVFSVTRNLGRGIIQGGEVELTIQPHRDIVISGFYGYTDAYYTRSIVPGLNPIDLSNLPFSNTPAHKLGVSGHYEVALTGIATLVLEANYAYQSRVYFQVPSVLPVIIDPQFGQSGYSLVNLRADLKDIGGRPVDVGVFVTNVTNKTYKVLETQLYPSPVGSTAGLFGEPRMIGAQLRFRF